MEVNWKGHPLFFLRLPLSERPKFLVFSEKKKSNDVVTIFFTWNNSFFYLKNEHSNSIDKNRNQKHEHFSQYLVHSVNPKMWMLTFNVVLGYQGLLFRDLLWFLKVFFFQSDRPTQYQETHSTVNEEKKGDGQRYGHSDENNYTINVFPIKKHCLFCILL